MRLIRIFLFLIVLMHGFIALGLAQEASQQVNQATDAAAAAATPAQATESQPTPSPTETAINPEEDIAKIQEKQKTIKTEIEEAKANLVIKEVTPPEAIMTAYRNQLDLLQRIEITYGQRITALEQYKTLQQQKEQFGEQVKKFEEEKPEQTPSFLELERLRGELNAERNRKESVQTKVEIAKSAQESAKTNLAERQTQKSVLQDKINNTQEEAQKRVLEAQLKTLNLQTRLAQETLRLRQVEHRVAQLAQDAYQSKLQYLEKQYQFLEENAQFGEEDLKQIQQQLQDEEHALKRQEDTLLKKKDIIQSRLEAARAKLARPDATLAVEEEVKARILENDENQFRIVTIQSKLELIAKRRTAWERRYEIFNNLASNEQYESWKQDARAVIDDLDMRLRQIANDLSINQNTLSQINTKIDGIGDDPNKILKHLQAQRDDLQQINQTYLDRQNEFQKTRRLHEQLVGEINQRIAALTLEERMERILQYEWMQNTVRTWVKVAVIFLVVFFALFFIRWFIANWLKKFAARKDAVIAPFILEGIKRIRTFFFFMVALFFSTPYLAMPENYRSNLTMALYVVLIIQGGILISYILRSWVFHHLARRAKRDQTTMGALAFFNFLIQFFVWAIVVLSALNAMGKDVTTLIAGLGVGGVAVALALQKILGDLFSSLSIVLDKPFVIGDFIIFDNYNILGTVERIGLKTTRLRSLTGEQIVCSNSYILEAQVRNFKRMHERRVLFKLGVIYQTSYEMLKRIPIILRDVVEAHDRTRFDRAHFQAYGDFSLNFEVVYYVLSSDYNIYMDIQQDINLEIYRRFKEEGIEFAYPTSMTYVNQDSPFQVVSNTEGPQQ